MLQNARLLFSSFYLKLAEEKRELFCRLTAFAVCQLSKEK